jgi:DNA-binding NtrC family response regulator
METMLDSERVLVVDDEQADLDATRDYLGAYGLMVDTASEREEAEALLLQRTYGLVVFDMRLTGVHGREGLELLRFVRQHRPSASVIVMTAHWSLELEWEVRRCGANAFIEKPVPLSELLRIGQTLLRRGNKGGGEP